MQEEVGAGYGRRGEQRAWAVVGECYDGDIGGVEEGGRVGRGVWDWFQCEVYHEDD